jgi:hypothetical protein
MKKYILEIMIVLCVLGFICCMIDYNARKNTVPVEKFIEGIIKDGGFEYNDKKYSIIITEEKEWVNV